MERATDRPGQAPSERHRRWAATMEGFAGPVTLRLAHVDSRATLRARAVPGPVDGSVTGPAEAHVSGPVDGSVSGPAEAHVSGPIDGSVTGAAALSQVVGAGMSRSDRESQEEHLLAPGAARARGAGRRLRPEEPDHWRTCFERDRDRILHSNAFRRLAGKTQVFVFPRDHQRTRLTHALEVAQVATSVARACGLNVALTEAIALGHDCGHGPGGHASEEAFDPFVAGGFDHAPWGANVSLEPLNLCAETLDGIRNHSWSRPAPATAEGEVVSWADRIAYVCHDWEDAEAAGIVSRAMLPDAVRDRCGQRRSQQLGTFIDALVAAVCTSGRVGMDTETAEALAAFRACNYERVYLRDASLTQGAAVVDVLRALVEHYAAHPQLIPDVRESGGLDGGRAAGLHASVAYVAGMTDRFAFQQAVDALGWDGAAIPWGVNTWDGLSEQ